MLQEEADEGSQRSVILDGSPKSLRRMQDPPVELEGDPSSHLVPFALDCTLLERSTHGALPSEMVST